MGWGGGVCLVSKTLGSFSECESGMGQIRNAILAVCNSRTVFGKPEYFAKISPRFTVLSFCNTDGKRISQVHKVLKYRMSRILTLNTIVGIGLFKLFANESKFSVKEMHL